MKAYFAFEGFEKDLEEELGSNITRYERLMLSDQAPTNLYWAQNIWHEPQVIRFQSISGAARALQSMQKLWAFYPYRHIRRGQLIQSHLAYFSPKPLVFGAPLPQAPLGSWTLIDENTLMASPNCSSPFANGEIVFQETQEPPSRAYLKLWEFFTRTGHQPQTHETCLELGASPGSWTWVLQKLSKKVISIDRSPLDPAISRLANVEFRQQNAFSIQGDDLVGVDWVFCDVVCYPEKLLEWIKTISRPKLRIVATIKFQNGVNKEILRDFAAIGNLVHLCHNKHEMTWYA
jgi:23S rRNA (cytidine2498-2'-O)-methyltransferase